MPWGAVRGLTSAQAEGMKKGGTGGQEGCLPLSLLVGSLSLSPEADWIFMLRTGTVCIETPWEQDQTGELEFEHSVFLMLVYIPKHSAAPGEL